MKKIILAALLLSTATAFADIPNLPVDRDAEEVRTSVIEGDAAVAVWESMGSKEIRGDQLRTGGSSHKVLRAKDGLDQVICTKTFSSIRNKSSVRCKTESSMDGEKLKTFVPTIRMG